MKREQIEAIARELREYLAPACHKTAIAGTLRRREREIDVLDLVLLPRRDHDLFGAEIPTYGSVGVRLKMLLTDGRLDWDTEDPADGPRQKRFRVLRLGGMRLDLWIAEPTNYGGILALRTGCPEFASALATPRQSGGLLPNWMTVHNGCAWQFGSVSAANAARAAKNTTGGTPLDCATEADFFAHLRFLLPCPWERGPEAAARIRATF